MDNDYRLNIDTRTFFYSSIVIPIPKVPRDRHGYLILRGGGALRILRRAKRRKFF